MKKSYRMPEVKTTMSDIRMNEDNLNWLVRIILRKICFALVRQGPLHQKRITAYYRIMHEAAKREFYEDNKPTFNSFLKECFCDANDEMCELCGKLSSNDMKLNDRSDFPKE